MILIKDMEMPKRCEDCWLMDSEDSWCCACRGKPLSADYRYGNKERPSWCPLVELPPKWIPVTERLPESKKDAYWVCTDTGYQCECRWTNNIYGFGISDRWGWSIMDVPQYQKVVAWRDLPESYEPPKEESPTIIEAEEVSE